MENWDPDIPKSMKTYQSLAAAKTRGVCVGVGVEMCAAVPYILRGNVSLLCFFSCSHLMGFRDDPLVFGMQPLAMT
jgi:hypothetical protein